MGIYSGYREVLIPIMQNQVLNNMEHEMVVGLGRGWGV